MSLYIPRHSPALERPLLLIAMDGWIDAGLAAATAAAQITTSISAEEIGFFDPDELVDYRSRRPVARIGDGVLETVEWSEPHLLAGSDRGGKDLLVLSGPEPDLRWHAFVEEMGGIAEQFGVRMAVLLGAFPAPAPHTRPVRLAATASSAELAARIGFVSGTLSVPAGIGTALEMSLAERGIPAVGLWARVPHYVSGMSFPAASAALIDGLASVGELDLDSSSMHALGDAALGRVDQLIAQSREHQAMVRQLEESVDQAEGTPLDIGHLPSGDEIAAELERYLRGEQ